MNNRNPSWLHMPNVCDKAKLSPPPVSPITGSWPLCGFHEQPHPLLAAHAQRRPAGCGILGRQRWRLGHGTGKLELHAFLHAICRASWMINLGSEKGTHSVLLLFCLQSGIRASLLSCWSLPRLRTSSECAPVRIHDRLRPGAVETASARAFTYHRSVEAEQLLMA